MEWEVEKDFEINNIKFKTIKKEKKMKAKMYLAAFAIMATAGLVSAQSQEKSESKKSCYVDANNNNICDKHENKTCANGNGKGLMDGSGKGKGLQNAKGNGQKQGKGNKRGANFVDANKDGVCDNK